MSILIIVYCSACKAFHHGKYEASPRLPSEPRTADYPLTNVPTPALAWFNHVSFSQTETASHHMPSWKKTWESHGKLM